MSKRLETTVSDAMYDAILEHAAGEGYANDRDRGKRAIVIRALHYWLNKHGHRATLLRMTDAEYAEHRSIKSGYPEGT